VLGVVTITESWSPKLGFLPVVPFPLAAFEILPELGECHVVVGDMSPSYSRD
jgi:hypothetical protein